MTAQVVGVLCPAFMKKFDTDYKPHQEWLLLAAYSYATSFKDCEAAVDLSPFTKKEKQTIKDLILAIGYYNNRPDHFLTWDYEISLTQSEYAHTRLVTLYATMVDYYSKTSIKIEEFYEGGFFDTFEYIWPDASRAFSELMCHGDKSMKTVEYIEHAMLDFFIKYNFTAPKWKKNVPTIPFKKESTRAIVLGDLLRFFHKTEHAYWANNEDPRKKDSAGVNLLCGHNDWILDVDGGVLCEVCDADRVWGGYAIT